MCWQHELQESQSMGWQNVGTKIKCLMKVQKLQWETWKGKGRSRGQGRREGQWWEAEVMLQGASCWQWNLHSEQWLIRTCSKICMFAEGRKKHLWWTARSWHNSRLPSFIPIGLQGTLLKNLLPFHLSSNTTCFAALLQTHDIKSTDQSFQYPESILLSWILAEQTSTRFFG